jgi:hypothetical protein
MTFDELPKFQGSDVVENDGVVKFIGRLVGPLQAKDGWIACLYLGSGRFVWGRFSEVDEVKRRAVFTLRDSSDRSAMSLGQQYPYLDGYWGDRAELVHDTSRVWIRTQFQPSDSSRDGQPVSDGWEHEHCSICWEKIAEYAQRFGYYDQNSDWVCESWPVRFDGKPPELKPSPKLGQHTDEVFASWLEMSSGDLKALREEKVIGS